MEREVIFWIISTVLFIICSIPFLLDVRRGRTVPHPFSWFVWLVMTGFNTLVLFSNHEYFSFASWIVNSFILSIGTTIWFLWIWKVSINWFDWACLILSIWLIVYYFTFRNILNTVIFSVIIDFIAYLPTIRKGWSSPWSETAIYYFLPGIAGACTILALNSPITETYLFWWYTFFSNTFFTTILIWRRWYLKWWKSIFE